MTAPRQILIGNRKVGEDAPAYVVAELSANHNQSFEQAKALIFAAKESGADAVKIQTYTPDTLTIDCDKPPFRIGKGTIWEGETLYGLYGKAYTPWEWQPDLKKVAEGLGMGFFSTAFDTSSVEFLETMEVAAFKIASFEIVDLQLIEKAAGTGKPLILSTGMASLSEIELAVETARRAGCSQLALLKCTSAYPARPEEMNLRVIPHLRDAFQVPVGLSDHTLGSAVAVAAVVLGACVVEKHFTVDRNLPGPDSPFSMTPQEFRDMVDAIRTAEKALGNVCYGLSASESPSLVFRRSLFVVEDMKVGDTFDESNLRAIRPGNGLPPKYLKEVLGRYAARDLERGMPLQWEDILGKRQA